LLLLSLVNFARPLKSRKSASLGVLGMFLAAGLLTISMSGQQFLPVTDIPTATPSAQWMTFLPDAGKVTATARQETGSLPDDPSAVLEAESTSVDSGPRDPQQTNEPRKSCLKCDVDANGNPIPLERQQPKRILGFMPNFRSVSAGAKVHPPGWKYNFTVATHQALDYSTFLFLGLTSLTAEGLDEHPSLGKGVPGFWAYTWRGFLDKTDGTYLSAWLLPSLLHEDTRFYPLGAGHNIAVRELYVISRQAVARTYGGRDTPNIAGLGGKVLTQEISRFYYPSSASSFGVLAEKFGYSVMRDVIFSNIREFYPDIAAHYVKKHREKVAATAARDANAAAGSHPTTQ
jgi:hypothetical protein